jgi:hypothetical protein
MFDTHCDVDESARRDIVVIYSIASRSALDQRSDLPPQ